MSGARLHVLAGIGADLLLPLALYYALRLAELGEPTALIGAAAVAMTRIGWVALRARQVSWLAALVGSNFAIGIALTLVTGDPRALLLKDSATTAAAGGVLLLSAACGHPLTLAAAQAFSPAQADALRHEFDANPRTRRYYRGGTLIWGGGMLAESALRLPLVALLPLDAATAASTALIFGTVAILAGWTLRRVRRHRRDKPVPEQRRDHPRNELDVTPKRATRR